MLTRRTLRARMARICAHSLLAIVPMLVLGIALEIGARNAGFAPLYATYSKPSTLWQHDPLHGWSHQPSSEDDFVGPRPWPIEFSARVQINSMGLRGPEIEPLPPGGYRVLLLGDSMVAGFEVPYEQTFGARLARSLERSLGAPVQVLNAGVRGYGTDQSYLFYRERGRALKPDLVVLDHSGNDAENNVTLHRMRRPFGKPAFSLGANGELVLHSYPTPDYPICSEVRMNEQMAVERRDGPVQRVMCGLQMTLFDHSALFTVVSSRIRQLPGLVSALYHAGSPSKLAESTSGTQGARARELTAAIAVALARAVEADGARFLLVGESQYLKTIDTDVLARAGVEVYDATLDRSGPDPIQFKNDSHYNQLGHLLMASRLEPIVRARLVGSLAVTEFPPTS